MNTFIGALQSKAMWLGVLTLIGANVDSIQHFILTNMHITGNTAVSVIGALVMVIRYFTDKSLAAKGASATT